MTTSTPLPTGYNHPGYDHAPDGCEVCATFPNAGHLIETLGAARDAGRISTEDAAARLIAADPSLSRLGAHAQLRSWRGAAARYAHQGTAPRVVAPSPIVFRAYR